MSKENLLNNNLNAIQNTILFIWINKNLIEIVGLLVLTVFSAHRILTSDQLFQYLKSRQKSEKGEPVVEKTKPEESKINVGRRELLKGFAALPFFGVFTLASIQKKRWVSYEEKNLVDAVTSASTKLFNPGELKELKGQILKAKIRNMDFSRLILGGNLLSGSAHSRDLIYVSQLVKAYHNKDKIFATLLMAEKCDRWYRCSSH